VHKVLDLVLSNPGEDKIGKEKNKIKIKIEIKNIPDPYKNKNP
jgi:hypothetical protein